jgi:hypothetical protein
MIDRVKMRETRIALIACSKSKSYTHDRKRGGRVLPAELYTGALFRKSVRHAEDRGIPWFVLSARFGLWPSHVELNAGEYDAGCGTWSPYDVTLSGMCAAEKAAWHTKVAWDVTHELWEPWEQGSADTHLQPNEMTIEIHAGRDYTHPLASILRSVGFCVELPLDGLQIGERLQWYCEQHNETPSAA